MKTQCPHCNQNYDVDDQNNGEIVTCEACKQEFVVEPIPEIECNAPNEAVTPTVPKAVLKVAPEVANPNLMFCRDCGKPISRESVICPGCGAKYGPGGEDKLSGRIILIMWLLLLLPFGGILVILTSSILYYAWKGSYPNKAKAVNRLGWLVFLVGILLWFVLFRLI